MKMQKSLKQLSAALRCGIGLLGAVLLLGSCTPPPTSAQKASSLPEAPVSEAVPAVPVSAEEPEPEPQPTEAVVRFSAVGDNLIHDGIYLQAARRAGGQGYDFNYVYENVKPFFEQFDVNWINQETLVNTQLEPSTYPCFSTPGELGQAAYDAGWRVFSMSNNHSYDKGAKGIAATLDFWASMPEDVRTTGFFVSNEEDSGITLQEVNGITIAYLSYTETTNGIPTPSSAPAHIIYTSERETIERQVRRARELADVVMVGVHWGVEGSHAVTQGQRDLAANLADWGADAVIGTHPHVIQPLEWITSREDGRPVIVTYSLGNFLSAQSAAKNMIGLAFTCDIHQTVLPDGTRQPVRIENVKVYPTVTHYDASYTNIRDYMLSDYTQELAQTHGVRAREPGFSMEYIQGLLEEYIPAEFLAE